MAEQRAAPYLFISYASDDRDRVLPVVAALERAGVPVWIDREGIAGGENYGTVIADAVKGSAAVLLMASAASLSSRNVKQEIALGWRFERPYLPLLLEAVAIPDDLAYWLEAAQWIEVLDRPEQQWLPQVLAALQPLGIIPATVEYEEIHLAGREKELTLLREKLVAAKEGRGGLVLIGGEAGIGKTTLADAAMTEAARQGFVRLEGHCFDLAETPPYGPFVDLFLHLPLSSVMPPLPPAFAERGTVGAVASQMALFAQVEDFLKALATRQPVALLLDDLHWADPASCDLLRFLGRSVATLPLLVLAAYRSDELTRKQPLYPLLPQLAREASAERIDLGRLDDEAVRDLIGERYGLADDDTQRLVAYVQGRAEGNALFVGELLRSLEEAGILRLEAEGCHLGDLTVSAIPVLLRQVIDGRLARLDDGCQRLLAIAAVVGQAVPLSAWAAVGEVDEEAVLAAAEQAERARLLAGTPEGDAVQFAHALIRESLYESIPSVRRRQLHRRVAEALSALAQSDPDAIAFHFRQAGDDRALPWLLEAGERAQAAFAWPTAVERFEAAAGLMPRSGLDAAERGWLLYRISRLRRWESAERSIACLDEALRTAEAVGDRALAALARFTRGCVHYFGTVGSAAGVAEVVAGVEAVAALSEPERGRIRPYESALAAYPPIGLVPTYAAIGRYRDVLAIIDGQPAAARDLAMTEEPETAALVNLRTHLAAANMMLGRPAEMRAAYARDSAHFRATHHDQRLAQALLQELTAVLVYQTDDVALRRQLAAEWEGAVRRARAVGAGDNVLDGWIPVLVLEGKWSEARPLAEALKSALYRTLVWEYAGLLAHAQGDIAWAWRIVETAVPGGVTAVPGDVFFVTAHHGQRLAAMLCLGTRDLPQARAWIEAYDRWSAWSGVVLGLSEGEALWGQYHRQAGDRDKAREHAERALAHATEPRQPLALIEAHRLLGELDTDAGSHDDAARHLNASLALADACEAPYERALTLLAMAELQATTGDTEDARRRLEEVMGICEPLGAKPTLARAAALGARLT